MSFSRDARDATKIGAIAAGVVIACKLALLLFSAMWAAGDGNGDIAGAFVWTWRTQGGVLGFFHLASDMTLAASSDPVISQAAATRLLIRHECDHSDEMLTLLKSDPGQSMLQVRLMEALASCKNEAAIPLFRSYLKDQSYPATAVTAAESLGIIRAREAIPDLETILERDDPKCAGSAAVALSRIGPSPAAHSWAVRVLALERPPKDIGSIDSLRRVDAGTVIENIGSVEDIPLLEKNRNSLGVFADYHKQAILKRAAPN